MIPAMLRSVCAAALCAWLLLGSLPAFAQESSGAYFSVMTGPLERVEAAFEELGVPLPRFLRRETIEDGLPFIGLEGLRGTGSLGMRVGPGEEGSGEPGAILVFPVTPDAALLREFTSRGARLLPDSDDTVRFKGKYFRRTRGFLLMGNSEEEISRVDPLAVEKRLSRPGLLAEIELNLGHWRESDPSTYSSIFTGEESSPSRFSHSFALGQGLITRVREQVLDRMRLTLSDAGPSLRLLVELAPLAPGEIDPLPKPAFPRGALGRVDIAYSSTESSQWIQSVAEEFLEAAEKDGLFASSRQAGVDVREVRALFQEFLEVFWVADAISLSAERLNGKIVYHQVNQYRGPAAFTARLAAVVKKINGLERQRGRRGAGLKLTTQVASGVRLTRLTFRGSKLTIDFAESGTTVRIVAAEDSRRRLPALLKLPASGTITSSFSGEIDPKAALDMYLAGGGQFPSPARSRAGLPRGQLITWSTRAEGEAAAVDFEIPKPLVQSFFQLLGSRPFDTGIVRL